MDRAQTQDMATAREPGVTKRPAADRPDALHPIGTDARMRIARPSRNLAAAMHFYVEGLGLEVFWHTTGTPPGEHDLLMVGPRGGVWHLELTHDPEPLEPTPTVDDLLVVHLGEPVSEDLLRRLLAAGGTNVAAHNPYRDKHGVTVAAPDGHRLVLCSRTLSA
jgi:hypothetical protein